MSTKTNKTKPRETMTAAELRRDEWVRTGESTGGRPIMANERQGRPETIESLKQRLATIAEAARSVGAPAAYIRELADPEGVARERRAQAAYRSPEPEMPPGARLSIAIRNEAKDDPTRAAVYEWAAGWADALEKASKACAKQMVDRGCLCPELLDLAIALRRPRGKRGAK